MENEELKLEHLTQIGGSDAHFPAIKAWVEIVEAGHSGNNGVVCPVSWNDRVSTLSDGNNVVALIVWQYTEFSREGFICLGWVAPDHRRQGLYRRLYAEVKAEAAKLGARWLRGGVALANEAIRASAKAMGRTESGITLRDEIKANESTDFRSGK